MCVFMFLCTHVLQSSSFGCDIIHLAEQFAHCSSSSLLGGFQQIQWTLKSARKMESLRNHRWIPKEIWTLDFTLAFLSKLRRQNPSENTITDLYSQKVYVPFSFPDQMNLPPL